MGTNFLKHILTVRGRILRQPAGARHQAKWGGVRWRERTGAPRGLWSGGGAGFAMERASGFGHWAEHSASPDPGAEPAEGVGLRPSRPGQRDIRTARAPRLPPAPPGPQRSSASLLWASVPLSAAGSNRSCPTCLVVNGVCQNSGHLEETESLTRQGCSFKPTPFLWRLPGLRVLIGQPLPQPGHSRLAWGRTPESTVLLGLWSTCRQVQGAWGRGWSRFHLFPPHESIKLMA